VLVGVGLGRFVYTPMLPALVAHQWLTASEAAYVGAANLAGYLAGALIAAELGRRLGAARTVRLALALSVLGLGACALPLGSWWFMGWRFLVGVTGAALMIVAPSQIIVRVAPGERGRAGGLIYTGVGLGVALSGALIGPLAALSPKLAWAMVAALALLAATVSLGRWREEEPAPARAEAGPAVPAAFGPAVLILFAAYAADGAGFVPHTLFWVDFIARELAFGTAMGTLNWLLFGVGAAAGPLIAGRLADGIGIGRTLALGFLAKSLAVLLPPLLPHPAVLAASSIVVGALTPGLTSLVATQLSQMIPAGRQARAWGIATLVFSATQALAGWGMSFAFDLTGAYRPLFVAAGLCEVVGLGLTLLHLRSVRAEHRRARAFTT
jgi:MFS family permease